MRLTRRDFIAVNAAALGAMRTIVNGTPARADTPSTLETSAFVPSREGTSFVSVDFKALVSTADLHYLSPVEDDTGEGLPIGNGRMGTAVWTTPSAVQFQINRVDVFGTNLNSFGTPSDVCGACGAITVDVGGDPFRKSEQFHQQLSVHGAECQIRGQGVQARCFVSAVSDVLVLEIDDQRPQPPPLRVTVKLWGEPVVEDGDQVSSFEFLAKGQQRGVARKFVRPEYFCRSAIAVHAPGKTLTPAGTTATTQTFEIQPSAGGTTVLHISSAASMKPEVDAVAQAFTLLETAAAQSYAALYTPHQDWWASFWKGTFVSVSSADTVAAFMQQIYHLHLYLMASTSRGALPAKWNGMLFTTKGDERSFGARFYGWTLDPYYAPLFAAGKSELADPYFDMIAAQVPRARIAAAQRWGAKGTFFPEIYVFEGPIPFPDDVAREFRETLLRAPDAAPLSEKAQRWLKNEMNVFDCGTNFSNGPRIAQQAWWRYRHTGDTAWLRTHCYPLLQGIVEFYRSRLQREGDGRYHLAYSNMYDGWPEVKDAILEMSAVRAVVPLAIRASEILGVDAELRPVWRDFLAQLTPLAMGSDPDAKALEGGVVADDVWAIGRLSASGATGAGASEDSWISPIYPFELYTLETPDPEMGRIARKVVELAPPYPDFMKGITGLHQSPRTPIAVARVGHGEALPAIMASYYQAFEPMPNGFSKLEEALGQGPSAEVMGMLGATLQDGLLQSISPAPGEPEVIRVFPAWPKGWDATFALEARGGFLVTSSIKGGVVAGVEITSHRGESCRIRNPWKGPCVLVEPGQAPRALTGDLVQFSTRAGAMYQLFQSQPPSPVEIAPAPKTTPTAYEFTLPSGIKAAGTLGRNK